MAVYKVIQDIEAEDTLIGKLSLRQFLYACGAAFCIYMCYVSVIRGAPFLLAVFLPPMFILGFFAFPWGKEQSTEIWALARIRFFVKPRKRIWNQTGVKELVTVTVPKKIEHTYTDGLSEREVKSRLQALAMTIDSRGWVIKNTEQNPYISPVFNQPSTNSDRLVSVQPSMPIIGDGSTLYDDVLDSANNPKAQQFENMLVKNAQDQRQRLMESMQSTDSMPKITQGYSTAPVALPQTPINPENVIYDAPILASPQNQSPTNSRLNTETADKLSEIDEYQPNTTKGITDQSEGQQQTVTPDPDTVILRLAHNDNVKISTIAKEAKRSQGEEPDEVVIPLH